MKITLLSLGLKGFKGGNETLNFDGENCSVMAENGGGKTRLLDAIYWLLFNQDSSGSSKFQIKPIVDGKVIHHQDVSVLATLQIDDRVVTLIKVLREVWGKDSKSRKEKLTKHTTEYYINDDPVKAKAYEEFINESIGAEVFQRFSSPTYIPGKLHWKLLRGIVFELCGGGVDDQKILKKHEALLELLAGRSVAAHHKTILNLRNEIDKDLDRIPIQIKEKKRDISKDAVPAIETLVRKGEDVIKKIASLRETLIKGRDNAGRKKILESITKKENFIDNLGRKLKDLQEENEKISWLLLEQQSNVVDIETETETGPDNKCKKCAQLLPINKRVSLEQWTEAKGLEIVAVEKEISSLESRNQLNDTCVFDTKCEIKKLRIDVDKLRGDLADQAKQEEEAGKKTVIALQETEAEKDRLGQLLVVAQANKKALDRIEELGEQEKELSKQAEGIAETIELINKFNRDKAEQVEGIVNGKFKLARFNLFNLKLNGEIEECCDVLDDKNVPFGSISRGEQNNIGTDMVNTLSDFFDISMPLFIDEAQSITHPEPTKNQCIKFIVRSDDCPECDGKGEIIINEVAATTCPVCFGTGKRPDAGKLTLRKD